MHPPIAEVRKNILKKNDVAAAALRRRFDTAGIFGTSLVSSPGSGRTAFLERTLSVMSALRRVAALVGDLATDRDADRLLRSSAPVQQITTGTTCYLDANTIAHALHGWLAVEAVLATSARSGPFSTCWRYRRTRARASRTGSRGWKRGRPSRILVSRAVDM